MLYRQSIALFGLVLPLAIAAAMIGGSFYLIGRMRTSLGEKAAKYKVYDQSRNAALEVEAQIGRKGEYMKVWKEKLAEETMSALSENLLVLKNTLPEKEFKNTGSAGDIGTAPVGGFSSITAQKSKQIHLGFRGNFRTVQRAFLELETRMPQLQLTELKMDPKVGIGNQPSLLNFDVTYTAWTN